MSYKDKDRQREWQHNKYATEISARRVAWITENGPCRICGSPLDLEIDHIDPETKHPSLGGVSVWSWEKTRREEELAKCQVLCCECHKKKTAEDRRQKNHGTERMYRKEKCRCDLCKSWKQKENAKGKERGWR